MRPRKIVPTLPLILCLAPTQFALAQASTQPSAVGQYQSHHGDPENDRDYSVMTLELKADNSMSTTLTMPDPANPGKTIVNNAEGSWARTGDVVKITAEKLNGQPIDASNPRKTLTLKISDGGKQLTSDGGPQFTRK